MPSVSRCPFSCSANTPAPQHTLLQTRDTMSARARTAAGSRERGRPRAVPGVLCENHLRGVSMCACSKKDGSALFAKRKHCTMVQSGLTRAREQNHSFTLGGMCVLRRFVQGSAGLSSPAPSPASAGSSPAGSATAVHHDVLLHGNVFCDCGHRELHRLPTLPPRWWLRPQIFDAAVHGFDEQTETLSPFSASGRPPNTTCPDTWPWEQKTCCLCTAPLETGLLLQSSMTLRSSTNDERCERALHGQKFCPTNTWDEKHFKIIINCRQWKPRRNTQAMAILCRKHKQWRYSAGNTSNDETLRETHKEMA